jgi:hypothetical protein
VVVVQVAELRVRSAVVHRGLRTGSRTDIEHGTPPPSSTWRESHTRERQQRRCLNAAAVPSWQCRVAGRGTRQMAQSDQRGTCEGHRPAVNRVGTRASSSQPARAPRARLLSDD